MPLTPPHASKARAHRWWCCAVVCASLAACEPSPPPGRTGLSDVRTPTYTVEGVAGCLHCHAGEFNRAIASTPHGDADDPDAPYGRHGCESCHGPGSFHVSRAYGGPGLPPLITFGSAPGAAGRDLQLAACRVCHNPASPGAAAIGFEGSVHDSRFINCSSCHVIHAAEEPLATPAGQAGVCLECHRSTREDHPLLAGRPVDFNRRACSRCHAVHPAPKRVSAVDAGAS